jgi:hypothetical protein
LLLEGLELLVALAVQRLLEFQDFLLVPVNLVNLVDTLRGSLVGLVGCHNHHKVVMAAIHKELLEES